jgi:predicted NAD/FAD-binding protein
MLDFPAIAFVRFFHNHGLLAASGQPQWYTVTGGSKEYVRRLTLSFAARIRTGCGVTEIRRTPKGVLVSDATGGREMYDHVILAGHADDSLRILSDADAEERALLGAFRYKANRAVLHKDVAVMPRRKKCWASWVYHADGSLDETGIAVSYWMNNLQGIDHRFPLFVTLNPNRDIAREHVFDEHIFQHPIFDAKALAAQPQLMRLQGHRNVFYCGAHMRNGFHEDGLWSAVQVARRFGVGLPWEAPAETATVTSNDIAALQAAVAE